MSWENIKPVLWGAVGGALGLAIVGFSWGGWVGSSKAQVLIADASEKAVIDRLTPICIDQFNRDLGKVQKLEEFKKIDGWDRGEFVGKQGWSTIPGEEGPDSKVSRECALQITKLSS